MKRFIQIALAIAFAKLFIIDAGHAQTSVFTYHGRLNDNGAPANGIYDFRFSIYDAPTNAPENMIAGPQPYWGIAVSNGLFTTQVDFGSTPFNGSARWLEIAARTNDGFSTWTILYPLQRLTSTPYAIHSANAATAAVANSAQSVVGTNITGTIPDTRLSANIPRLNGTNISFATNIFFGMNTFAGVSSFAETLNTRDIDLAAGSGIFFNGMNLISAGLDTLTIVGSGYGTGNAKIDLVADEIKFFGPVRAVVGGQFFGSMVFNPISGTNTNIVTTIINEGGIACGSAACDGFSWNDASDRNLKENFESLDTLDVLERVAALPISKWNYKAKTGTQHVGPMAQDFHAAFGLGSDDKHIATVDA